MWIVIAGGPIGGFSLYGPMTEEEEAMAAGRLIGIMHGGNGTKSGFDDDGDRVGDPWYEFELVEPEQADRLRVGIHGGGDPLLWDVKKTPLFGELLPGLWSEMFSGVTVVFSGLRGLNDGWVFFGPFSDINAACKFAAERGMEAIPLLKPFTEEHLRRGEERRAATA
jgi:hypothetical protein